MSRSRILGLAQLRAPALDRPWRRPGRFGYALSRLRGFAKPPVTATDPPGDILIERDTEVRTRDGTVLRANIFRPPGEKRRAVIVSAHPYGKDSLPMRRGKRWALLPQYHLLRQPSPVRFSALTGWDVPDPAWWVRQGFVVINADLRGCVHSDGVAKLLSQQESEDVYDLVQWAAAQRWSDGRVAMLGVSYAAMSQYGTAALHPPALRAICPWEGFTDAYRDLAFPGGIRARGLLRVWSLLLRCTVRMAYYDFAAMQSAHPLRDNFWQSLVPNLPAIRVPILVCGSFSNSLHSRGSVRAFTHAGSEYARLYTHRGGKWSTFYSQRALAEQLAFIRGALDGTLPKRRSVRLEVREDRDTVASVREESEWPLARTRWRPLYLAGSGVLAVEPPTSAGRIRFQTRSRAAAFSWTVPNDIELIGPMAARLWLQVHGNDDVNLFVGVEKWRGATFVPFEGAYGYGLDRVTTGWQKASLRALDPELSKPWEPVPSCTDPRPLRPGEVVAVDVALGPSATLFRAGEQVRLVVAARPLSPRNPLTGQFPAIYPRPPRGRVTLHWGPQHDAHLLMPEIPGRRSS